MKRIRSYTIRIALIVLTVVLVRMLVADTFQVDSQSMEGRLKAGDVVLVNKLCYGARLPLRPGDIPFAAAVLYALGGYQKSEGIHWRYRRLPGWGTVQRNDVLVFNQPGATGALVKRCVGLPGDTIRIAHNQRYANGQLQEEPATVKFSWRLVMDMNSPAVDSLSAYGLLTHNYLWRQGDSLHVSLSRAEAAVVARLPFIHALTMDDYPAGAPGPALFAAWPDTLPTRENYGPLVIPAKGTRIVLNKTNIRLYHTAIEQEVGQPLVVQADRLLLHGLPVRQYTFQYDHYFVMGDNRYHSLDSRYWGFLCERSIIGKVTGVLF